VWCWGAWAGHHAGGMGDERVPVRLAGVTGATSICAGQGHSCILTGDGRVLCWGRNGFGEAGQSPRHAEVFPPVEVPGLTGATDLTCGLHHTCVIVGGNARCWGRNDYGQLGTDRAVRHEAPTDLAMARGGLTDISAGGRHTCATSSRSSRYCWGFGGTGALGHGDVAWSTTPVGGMVLDAGAVASGSFHSCTIASPLFGGASSLACWGSNEHGQAGAAGAGPLLSPATVSGVTGVAYVAAGRAHSCAASATEVYCWGGNDAGQLGNGGTTSTYVPQLVGLATVTGLSSRWDHTCAVLRDQTLRCWGLNDRGQLGDGSAEAMRTSPVEPVGL
jgi:alpha-tubulin suppressor-like RCC1 family protein